MNRLGFKFEWEDPRGARGAEFRATWANLAIVVKGFPPITQVHDERSKGVRSSIYVSLYPLAEWFATHWWALFREIEAPRTERASTYYRRHDISSAQEGFALPRLSLVPTGRDTVLRWTREDRRDAYLVFLGEGCLTVSTDEVRAAVSDFVSAVVARLDEQGVFGTLLQEEWESISALDSEERDFCETVGAMGLDPFAMDDLLRSRVMKACSAVPPSILEEFLAVVDSSSILESAEAMVGLLARLRESPSHFSTLVGLRHRTSFPALGDLAWKRGYSSAQKLRSELGLNGDLLREVSGLAAALGLVPAVLESALSPASLLPRSYDAILGTNSEGSPAFLMAKRHGNSGKFAFCRALYEYLSSQESQHMALVSAAHSDRQQANRAFAAEFLAPAHLIRERIEGSKVDEEQLDDIGEEFGVSSMVIRHQIVNHRLAAIGSSPCP